VTAVGVAVVSVWAVAGLVLVAAGSRRVGVEVLGTAVVGAVAVWGADRSSAAGAVAACAVPAAAGAVALALPDGRVRGLGRASAALVLAAGAAVAAVVYVAVDRVPSGFEVLAGSAVAVMVVAPSVRRHARRASPTERSRLQLLAAGVLASSAVALAAGAIAIVGDDDVAASVVLAAGAVPALALAGGCSAAVRRAAPAIVSAATSALTVAVVATAAFALAILVTGRTPQGDERSLVALTFLAIAAAALAFAPLRRRGGEMTSRWVFGARRRVEDAGRTLTARAAEGAPLDDLLVQLAGSVRGALGARAAEVWTRAGEAFELAASSPDRGGSARLECTSDETATLGRVAVAGDAWLDSWLPRVRDRHPDVQLRVAPAVHTGAVLGFLLVERPHDDVPFGEDEDRALGEIARRLAEVLHARRLGAELTSTLDDLRASRARLVAAADAERRRIERNLHDGAQQHLVALAVSLRLARDIVRDDPDAGIELLDQLGEDVRDTIQQLRDLAHGIYPPLLADSGLAEALRAAAQRSPQPVRVDAIDDRFAVDVEAAVYFCCLEALQNAAKHAPGAPVEVRVWRDDGALRFEVLDEGPGFDAASTPSGQGFQNMADRLGAIGGRVEWHGAPGRGARVTGEVRL
jgi:signal transduction histidine kinase